MSASFQSPGALGGQASLCIIWVFTHSCTVGLIAYTIVFEALSVRLRPLSVYLARTSQQIIDVVSQVLAPYFMNRTVWKVKGKRRFSGARRRFTCSCGCNSVCRR